MKPKKITFKNGLRLIMAPQRGARTATVLMLVGAGSEYETKRVNGVAHFLEHMVFKGTENRPRPGMISEELESLGAEYNAFTSYEYTGYWAKAGKNRAEKLFELISDMYLHPIFDPKELEKERGVIIEEINMYEDMPQRKVWDAFGELLYGNQPAGWNVAGDKQTVTKIMRGDVAGFRRNHYTPENTVAIIAGAFPESAIRSYAREHLASLSRRRAPKKPKTEEAQSRPALRIVKKKSDQTHLVLGVRAFPVSDTRRHALGVLSCILGGGMSSRLFHKVREEMGAAYYVRTSSDLLADHGSFAASLGVNHGKLGDVVHGIVHEFSRMKEELTPEKELKKVKEQLISGLMMGIETTDELASFYGSQEIITGKMITPEASADHIRRVTAKEVRNLARELFINKSLNCAIVGPVKNGAELKTLLRFGA